jgi:hypothetical protein
VRERCGDQLCFVPPNGIAAVCCTFSLSNSRGLEYPVSMEWTRGIGFFLLVLYFAGSVVVVAARDIRVKLEKQGTSKKTEVAALIQQLRGEPLQQKGAPFVHGESLPERNRGRILTKHDQSFFRRILRVFVSVGEDATS